MQHQLVKLILVSQLVVLLTNLHVDVAFGATRLENDCRKNAAEESFHREALVACKSLYESLNARDKWLILRFGQLLEQSHSLEEAYHVYADGVHRYKDSAIRARYEIVQTLIEEESNLVVANLAESNIARDAEFDQRRRRIECRIKRVAGATEMPAECAESAMRQFRGQNEMTQSEAETHEAAFSMNDSASGSDPGRSEHINSDIVRLERKLSELRHLVEKNIPAQKPGQSESTRVSLRSSQLEAVPDLRPRHALVIGNAAYVSENRQLGSPENDAGDVAVALRRLGFDVALHLNVESQIQFETILREHQKVLLRDPESIGLVFYAGHAIQFEGENYLIPTASSILGPQDVRAKTLSMSYVHDTLAFADNGLNIVVLDACRDNPFKSFTRTTAMGLSASRPATDGYLVIYAARPGYQAIDSAGRNSPFTKHFVRTIEDSTEPVEMMFKRLARAVDAETNGTQTPWLEGQYLGEFAFNPVRN